MRDSEVVASIVAGDPRGLAIAYDRYADPLYKYCRTLLSDPADAADAVLDEAPDVTDGPVEVGHDAERADLRALLENATDGLNPGEREVIELQLRQGLDPAEVATVLGVSRNHAHALLSRAHNQLGTCLAVLLVGRAGRDDCGELDAMLAGWDGRLTVLLRKRVQRHIEHCAVCGTRRASELRPAMLLDLSHGAALAAGAELSFRLAAGLPEGVRAHTITIATGQGAGAIAHRTAVLGRIGAFGHGGFPKPVHGGNAALDGISGRAGGIGGGAGGIGGRAGGVKRALRASPRGQVTVAVVVVVVVVVAIAAAAFALTGNPTPGTLSASPRGGTAAAPEPMVLAPSGAGRQIELNASGSGYWDVDWSVTVANDSGGAVGLSPAYSGTLTAADTSVSLTVTAHQFIPCGSAASPIITVNPGGAVYSVCTSLPKHYRAPGGDGN
jgi:DNA-directed RNA polymerase specialized sigma24 family protein